MNNFININGRNIGADYSLHIISEMFANHNRDISNSCKILNMVNNCGADALI